MPRSHGGCSAHMTHMPPEAMVGMDNKMMQMMPPKPWGGMDAQMMQMMPQDVWKV